MLGDKNLYLSSLLGRDYTFPENLEEWDTATALYVYVTQQFEKYTGLYLDMIFEVVKMSYRNDKYGKLGYIPNKFIYIEKGDIKVKKPFMAEKGDFVKLNCVDMGLDILLDFYCHYMKDLTYRCLEGMIYKKKMNKYEEYLRNKVMNLRFHMEDSPIYRELFIKRDDVPSRLIETLDETVQEIEYENRITGKYDDKRIRQTKRFISMELGLRIKELGVQKRVEER